MGHRRPRTLATLVLMLMLAVSGGCGSQRTRTPAEQAVGIARAFLADCKHGEPERANDLLTPRARATFADAGPASASCLRFLGFRDAAARLSRSEQEAMLRRATVGAGHAGGSAQSATVTVDEPGRRPHRMYLERRAHQWLLTPPMSPDRSAKTRSERAARNAAASFPTLCARHEYDGAEQLLSDSSKHDFEAAGANADACLKFLGLSKPSEDLSRLEEDQLLRDAKVGDIRDVEPSSATVTVTTGRHRAGDVEAEDHGQLWRLTKPSGSPREAVESLLDSCARAQYHAAAELLAKPARTKFLANGGDLDACERFFAPAGAVHHHDSRAREAFAEAKVSGVKVSGEHARIDVRVPLYGPREIAAERHDHLWKVAAARS